MLSDPPQKSDKFPKYHSVYQKPVRKNVDLHSLCNQQIHKLKCIIQRWLCQFFCKSFFNSRNMNLSPWSTNLPCLSGNARLDCLQSNAMFPFIFRSEGENHGQHISMYRRSWKLLWKNLVLKAYYPIFLSNNLYVLLFSINQSNNRTATCIPEKRYRAANSRWGRDWI